MAGENGGVGRLRRLEAILDGTKPAKEPRKRASPKPKPANISISGTGNVVGDGNSVVNHVFHHPPPIITKVIVKPGDGVITEQQKVTLTGLVDDIAALEAELKREPMPRAGIWKALNKKMRVTSYHQIPAEKFAAARKTLDEWRGRLLSARSAPKKLGDEFRKRRITAIQTRSRQVPDGTAKRLAYLQEQFGVSSLTDLDADQLERCYQHVMKWKP